MELNKIYNGDCLDLMKNIKDKSIDMILCDLPYGTTACKWDTIIPFDKLWEQYKRIIKDNGTIALTGSEPFSSYLRISNIKWYKYDWIWNKKLAGNAILCKIQPLKIHETISIFCKNKSNYYPIIKKGLLRKKMTSNIKSPEIYNITTKPQKTKNDEYYPKTILEYHVSRNKRTHPTEKPVKLFEYLIKTYTKENEIILDNCSGSGTTAIACINTKRKYICIEKDEKYYEMSLQRVKDFTAQLTLF